MFHPNYQYKKINKENSVVRDDDDISFIVFKLLNSCSFIIRIKADELCAVKI